MKFLKFILSLFKDRCIKCNKILTAEGRVGERCCDCDQEWVYDYEHGGGGR
jgi:hypothetical protein